MIYFLIAAFAAVLSWFLASCFYDVACEKGFDDKKIFWICFVFGIVGYILVAALPDRKPGTSN